MIFELWNATQGLLGLMDMFKKGDRERRDRIADYFCTIGGIIKECAEVFKNGEIPHGSCEQMRIQAEMFIDVIGDTIDKDLASDYQKRLYDCHELELMMVAVEEGDRAENIATLERISGSFAGMGIAIKAQK